MNNGKSYLFFTASTLALLLLWYLLTDTPEPIQIDTQSNQQNIIIESYKTLLSRVDSLEFELANEKSLHLQHELRLSELEQQLSDSQSLPIKTTEEELVQQSDEPEITIKPPTLQDKLLNSNIPLDTIQRIQQRVGQNRLARLELRDRAIREDWIDTPEYIQQEQQLPGATAGLKEEFGEQVYDQYLFASGRPNRVIVREVFSGSAASEAGIQARDIILSYASVVIFTMSDLQQVTTEGISGEPVLIELLRDDLVFSTSAPRGPLGITMSITRKEPE